MDDVLLRGGTQRTLNASHQNGGTTAVCSVLSGSALFCSGHSARLGEARGSWRYPGEIAFAHKREGSSDDVTIQSCNIKHVLFGWWHALGRPSRRCVVGRRPLCSGHPATLTAEAASENRKKKRVMMVGTHKILPVGRCPNSLRALGLSIVPDHLFTKGLDVRGLFFSALLLNNSQEGSGQMLLRLPTCPAVPPFLLRAPKKAGPDSRHLDSPEAINFFSCSQ